ncbi:MAG: ACP S-malonyltransferase [Chloroflexi bacterium]|nr:ACP S-malonyltransferase [Chloroflexota bacterium]
MVSPEEGSMSRFALVFPGQGSQAVGMARALVEAFPSAREAMAEADDILHFHLSRLCFEGPADKLTDTVNAQPAILAASVATLRAIRSAFPKLGKPVAVAGHSLGEYTALVAADALSYTDALRLVRERGRLMKRAGEERPGGMAAIISLEEEQVAQVCQQASQETGGVVQVANINSPGQIVISGEHSALERAMELARTMGARRVIRLAVSIAAHSPLMAPAAEALQHVVRIVEMRPAVPELIANVSAAPISAVEAVRDELVSQLTGPVRWTASVQNMIRQGIDTFIEVGPGNVLSGLIRRIDRNVRTLSINEPKDIEALESLA